MGCHTVFPKFARAEGSYAFRLNKYGWGKHGPGRIWRRNCQSPLIWDAVIPSFDIMESAMGYRIGYNARSKAADPDAGGPRPPGRPAYVATDEALRRQLYDNAHDPNLCPKVLAAFASFISPPAPLPPPAAIRQP